MLPFARIFSVSLIFYWLMCEVYFALCERVMDNAALHENILNSLISDWSVLEVYFPLCERVMDFSDLCENIMVNAALCKNISKLATPSDDFPPAE